MEVDEAGNLFEGEQERSDIGGWKVLLLKSSFYAEIDRSRGASGDMRLSVLGQT